MVKGSKLKFRMFWGLIAMFIEVIGEKAGRGGGGHLRVNNAYANQLQHIQKLVVHNLSFKYSKFIPIVS